MFDVALAMRLTHEQVIRIRDVAPDSEELHEVVELPVNITAYLRRAGVSALQFRHRLAAPH